MNTKHTCGGPSFGRLAQAGTCNRCDELRNGVPARQWKPSNDVMRCLEIKDHFNSQYHLSGKCGPVCTFGDW